jgi:hypothetical protein
MNQLFFLLVKVLYRASKIIIIKFIPNIIANPQAMFKGLLYASRRHCVNKTIKLAIEPDQIPINIFS